MEMAAIDGDHPVPSAGMDETVSKAELLRQLDLLQKQLEEVRAKKAVALADVTPRRAGRLILVSYKLPVELRLEADGSWSVIVDFDAHLMDQRMQAYRPLVGAPQGVLWIGGVAVPPGASLNAAGMASVREALSKHSMVPVFLPPVDRDLHYYGFCRTFLWPVWHSDVPSTDLLMHAHVWAGGRHFTEADMFAAYTRVCNTFAQAILEFTARPPRVEAATGASADTSEDVILINGYELMLCPATVRAARPQAVIGLFWHTPFPSSELFRVIARRNELLTGVLGADLIGFHTQNYVRHFLSCCVRILGVVGTPSGLRFGGRDIRLLASPLGVHIPTYQHLVASPTVHQRIAAMRHLFSDVTVLLAVDTLDPTKGITKKMLAFDAMLQAHPDLVGKVALIQVTSPATASLFAKAGSSLLMEVQETVGRLNGRYAKITGESTTVGGPIYHIASRLSPQDLVALFATADVFVTTALRDGMNMDPVAYTVARVAAGQPAMAVLSEFAGSSNFLRDGCFAVNPHNPKETAQALYDAVTASDDMKAARSANLWAATQSQLSAYRWFFSLASALAQIVETRVAAPSMPLAPARLNVADTVRIMSSAGRTVLLLDSDMMRVTVPSAVAAFTNLCQSMRAAKPDVLLMVTTSGTRSDVEAFVGHQDVICIADGGAWVKWGPWYEWMRLGCRVTDPAGANEDGWRRQITSVLQYFVERTAGSRIVKSGNIVEWHFGSAAGDHLAQQVRDLVSTLADLTTRLPVQIVPLADRVRIQACETTLASAVVQAVAMLSGQCARPSVQLSGAGIAVMAKARFGNEAPDAAALAHEAGQYQKRLWHSEPVACLCALLGPASGRLWKLDWTSAPLATMGMRSPRSAGSVVQAPVDTASDGARLLHEPTDGSTGTHKHMATQMPHRGRSSMFSFVDLSRLLDQPVSAVVSPKTQAFPQAFASTDAAYDADITVAPSIDVAGGAPPSSAVPGRRAPKPIMSFFDFGDAPAITSPVTARGGPSPSRMASARSIRAGDASGGGDLDGSASKFAPHETMPGNAGAAADDPANRQRRALSDGQQPGAYAPDAPQPRVVGYRGRTLTYDRFGMLQEFSQGGGDDDAESVFPFTDADAGANIVEHARNWHPSTTTSFGTESSAALENAATATSTLPGTPMDGLAASPRALLARITAPALIVECALLPHADDTRTSLYTDNWHDYAQLLCGLARLPEGAVDALWD